MSNKIESIMQALIEYGIKGKCTIRCTNQMGEKEVITFNAKDKGRKYQYENITTGECMGINNQIY